MNKGIPMPVAKRHKPFSEKRCARCNEDEFRIDGYCTIYCQDMAEVEDALASAQERIEELDKRNHQHTYCAWCGREFKADTEHATADVGEHIWECEKHPLALLVESVEERCKDLDSAAQELLLTQDETDLSHASGIHKSIDRIRQEIEDAKRPYLATHQGEK